MQDERLTRKRQISKKIDLFKGKLYLVYNLKLILNYRPI